MPVEPLPPRPSVKELRLRFEKGSKPAQTPAAFHEAARARSRIAPASEASRFASKHNLLVQASLISERRKSALGPAAAPLEVKRAKDEVEMQDLEDWLEESEPVWIDELLKGDDNAPATFEFFAPEAEAVTNESVLRFFFENHDPKRVGEVDALLAANKGREEALFIELSSAYPEPSTAFAFMVVQHEQNLRSAEGVGAAAVGEPNKRRPSFITSGIRRQSGWQVNLAELSASDSA